MFPAHLRCHGFGFYVCWVHPCLSVTILYLRTRGYVSLSPLWIVMMTFLKDSTQATSYAKGVAAEHLATEYLQTMGYVLWHTGYKTRCGEWDRVIRCKQYLFSNIKCFFWLQKIEISWNIYAHKIRSNHRRLKQSAFAWLYVYNSIRPLLVKTSYLKVNIRTINQLIKSN